jgi:hypothetical protein
LPYIFYHLCYWTALSFIFYPPFVVFFVLSVLSTRNIYSCSTDHQIRHQRDTPNVSTESRPTTTRPQWRIQKKNIKTLSISPSLLPLITLERTSTSLRGSPRYLIIALVYSFSLLLCSPDLYVLIPRLFRLFRLFSLLLNDHETWRPSSHRAPKPTSSKSSFSCSSSSRSSAASSWRRSGTPTLAPVVAISTPTSVAMVTLIMSKILLLPVLPRARSIRGLLSSRVLGVLFVPMTRTMILASNWVRQVRLLLLLVRPIHGLSSLFFHMTLGANLSPAPYYPIKTAPSTVTQSSTLSTIERVQRRNAERNTAASLPYKIYIFVETISFSRCVLPRDHYCRSNVTVCPEAFQIGAPETMSAAPQFLPNPLC